MSDIFGDMLPFGDRDPLHGAIQRFEVPAPTEEMRKAHRAEIARITDEEDVERIPTMGSVEAGLRENAVETFDVQPPTAEMLAEHRAEYARVAGTVGSEAVKLSKAGINWAAVRAGIKGRVI